MQTLAKAGKAVALAQEEGTARGLKLVDALIAESESDRCRNGGADLQRAGCQL